MWENNYLSAAIKGIILGLLVNLIFIPTLSVSPLSDVSLNVWLKVFFKSGEMYRPGIIGIALGPVIGILAFKIKRYRRTLLFLIGIIVYFIVIYISLLINGILDKLFFELFTFENAISFFSLNSDYYFALLHYFPSMIISMLLLEKWTRPKKLSFKSKRDQDKWFIWPQKR